MKTKKFFLMLSFMIIDFSLVSCTFSFFNNLKDDEDTSYLIKNRKNYNQVVNITENTDEMYNPDQGFYRTIKFKVDDNGITFGDKDNPQKVNVLSTNTTKIHNDKWYAIKDYDYYLQHQNDNWDSIACKTEFNQLYHLRFDISNFSGKFSTDGKDKEFTQNVLNDLEVILNTMKDMGFNVIIRFCYSPYFEWSDKESEYKDLGYSSSNYKNFEASKEYMIKHIDSVCPILVKYEDTISAIEVGLVGPWGEMHTTSLAENDIFLIPDLLEEYLSKTANTNIPISVRTPDRIYAYIYKYILNKDTSKINKRIKFSQIDGYSIPENTKVSRIGLYNDGYLGSASDSGTFRSDDASRDEQVMWLGQNVTNNTPYGGEVINPDNNVHYKLDNTTDFNTEDEMFKMNLSYMNISWNDKIISYWHKTPYTGSDSAYNGKSCFTYIKNHMGYRFLLTKSIFSIPDDFSDIYIRLEMKNIGFGNLTKKKNVSLLFVNNDKVIKTYENIGTFTGQDILEVNTKLNLDFSTYKNYDVYLRIDNGNNEYQMQFANKDIWNSTLKANKIGKI